MRILYDGNIYALQPAGGITRYFGSIISRLPEDFEPSLVLGHKLNENYPPHRNLKVFQHDQFHRLSLSYRLSLQYSKLRDRAMRARLSRTRFDVIHPTYYTLLDDRPVDSYRGPVVITVWDMIHEIYPAELDPDGAFAALKKRAVEAAEIVICISESTKNDLLNMYSMPDSKVVVTHLASELDVTLSYGSDPVPARPYFLFVGRRGGYKNFAGLLGSFAKLATKHPDLAICVVGSPLDDGEHKQIAELGLSDRIEHYGYPGDRQLAKLYRHSLALVYPSRYEGFGLPPLEAMACGTVAVVCRTSSIPEVVGDAGVFVDPDSDDDLADVLDTLARDQGLREELILKGREQAKKFTWERTVAQTIEAYQMAGRATGQ
jgi:glycosyltransferase involved in cell wall biosynthesis